MIIVSIDDFRRCAELSRRVGKWQAWRDYYFPKYEDVFAPMLKYLYRCDVDDLRYAVESFDFDHAMRIASRFFQDDGFSQVESLLLKAEERCNFDKDYDLYLLIGLGHVDGTSLPAKKPFLYFGLERYEPDHLKYCVPHEYNHLVRIWSVYAGEIGEPRLGEIVIMEGLAVVFSAMIADNKSPAEIDDALLMPKRDIEWCYEHKEELLAEVQGHWNDVISSELLDAYLIGGYEWKGGRPARIGYFVGAHIVNAVLAEGYEIDTLTKMPAEKIMELYYSMGSRLTCAST